jgi:hypothetical protein
MNIINRLGQLAYLLQGGSTACLVASANSGWLGGAGLDVGIGTDFYRFGCASVSVEALRFVWASATVGWGASVLVGCEGWSLRVEDEHLGEMYL